MPQDWQVYWKVQGLVPPKERLAFNDRLLFRRPKEWEEEGDDVSYVFFRVAVESEDELDLKAKEIEEELRKILQVYGLITGIYAEVPSHLAWTTIDLNRPFGEPEYYTEITGVSKLSEEEVEIYTLQLKRTIDKFYSIKTIFEDKEKAFLRNAIDYYHRALRDPRLEEQIIDLMVSMESLFSRELQELRLRISLRAAFFLSVGQESQLPKIFKEIYDLYDKRSKVVHGEEVKLSYDEIYSLKKYVLESLKRLIHLKMKKEEIIKLLDEAITDKDKRKELEQLVSEASRAWG